MCQNYNISENYLNEIIKNFKGLKSIIKARYFDPTSFFNNKENNKFNNILIQNDSYEFLIDLFDKLEINLKYMINADLIKHFFEFKLINEIYFSTECKHISNNTDIKYALEIDIDNNTNLIDSLNKLITYE